MTVMSALAAPILSILLLARHVEGIARMQSNLTAAAGSSIAFTKEMAYTTNSLCRQNMCTNPIFPGINDLPRLEALQWQCSTTSATREYMDFCKDAIVYDPALPSPQGEAKAVMDLVKAQDDAAMTMFFYHLSGMGFDAWDNQNPSLSDNNCVRSVWKMVCFTYFPRADAGCQPGQVSFYKRPCKSCCQNYIQQCGVECCDESVQCSFAHTSTNDKTGEVKLLQTGYVDQNGPSAACTGAARRSLSSPLIILLGIFGLHFATSSSSHSTYKQDVTEMRRPRTFSRCFFLGLVVLSALLLQGCEMDIPRHQVGNWRTKPNYLNEYKYIPAGKPPSAGVLNSCNQPDVPTTQQCGGRGYCKSFSTSSLAAQQHSTSPLAFCFCERDWADPECGTKRKSQRTAFIWSLFLGWTGADYFYLGFPLWGVGKLVTLGGGGFWWILDIVRTGVGPVYAHDYRTANDLPHWLAVVVMIFLCMLLGFFSAVQHYLLYRRKRRNDLMLAQLKEEARVPKQHPEGCGSEKEMKSYSGPRYEVKHRVPNFSRPMGFCGYGATPGMAMPLPLLNGDKGNYASKQQPIVGPFGPAGLPGQGSPCLPAKPDMVAPTHMENYNREGTNFNTPQPQRL